MQNEKSVTNSDQFITLNRDTPWKTQAVTGAIIGILPLLIGTLILYLTFTHLDTEPLSESWVVLVVGGAFALVGLLLEFSSIHQMIASRLPEAEVAIDRLPLHAGETFCLRVVQPGPIRLQSLSANLVCEVSVRHERKNPQQGDRSSYSTTTYPHQINILRTGAVQAVPGTRIEELAEFTVPETIEPTNRDAARKVSWRIELWGKVDGHPDFMHPYTIPCR